MEYIELVPFSKATGVIQLPGSKSISVRTLLLASLADGRTLIQGLVVCDDVLYMLESLKTLGVHIERIDNEQMLVDGVNGVFPMKKAKLFLGNAALVFRTLIGVLALSKGEFYLEGTPRMHQRPIGDLVDALRKLGAEIQYESNEGFPPITIKPGEVRSIDEIKVRAKISSQFLTSLLICLPLNRMERKIEVIDELSSKPYVEMTMKMIERFGVKIEVDKSWKKFYIPPGQRYRSIDLVEIEGDASSASYFLAAGVIGGGPVRVNGVGRKSIQGDVYFAEILSTMGASVSFGENWIEVSSGEILSPIDCDLNDIPDAAMTLSIVTLFARGKSILRNIGTWRLKETDRLFAMATELRKLGGKIHETADSIEIEPPETFPRHVSIETYDDHRIAMCFSLLSLRGISVRIQNPLCVTKSFPDFFENFQRLRS